MVGIQNAMKYGNINTGVIQLQLPSGGLSTSTGHFTPQPGLLEWATVGWREVVSEDDPPDGRRIVTQGVVELTGLTCNLTVATSVNIAAEQAVAKDLETSTKWIGKTLTDKLNADKYTGLV